MDTALTALEAGASRLCKARRASGGLMAGERGQMAAYCAAWRRRAGGGEWLRRGPSTVYTLGVVAVGARHGEVGGPGGNYAAEAAAAAQRGSNTEASVRAEANRQQWRKRSRRR
ncbi:hypothetical protein FGB62_342g01 [Gracilaria domingensis]|nr:hypothetical protein FGB62_342g01 [Gracilaria domingensis]